MPKIQDRRIGEGAAQPDVTKEKGTAPVETAPRENHTPNSTERPLYWPLTWRDGKPAKFRGKGKRNARRAAADRKRGMRGAVDTNLAGWLALALVAGVLLVGGLQ